MLVLVVAAADSGSGGAQRPGPASGEGFMSQPRTRAGASAGKAGSSAASAASAAPFSCPLGPPPPPAPTLFSIIDADSSIPRPAPSAPSSVTTLFAAWPSRHQSSRRRWVGRLACSMRVVDGGLRSVNHRGGQACGPTSHSRLTALRDAVHRVHRVHPAAPPAQGGLGTMPPGQRGNAKAFGDLFCVISCVTGWRKGRGWLSPARTVRDETACRLRLASGPPGLER